MSNVATNEKVQTIKEISLSAKITKDMETLIIANYEAKKAAEAEALKAAEAEAIQLAAEAAEAEALKAAEAKKAEAKEIRAKKVDSNNDALSELLPFDVAFKYAIKDINNNGISYYLKAVQKDVFNQLHFEQLIKSINLCLKQFSVKDIEKYVSDNRCTMPSKFIDAVVLGSCKSVKAFENSKAKVLPQNSKIAI